MATPAARSRAPILRQFRTTGADIAAPTRAARSVRAGTVLRSGIVLLVAAASLAGCAASRIGDARAQALLALPGPQHYAERRVARELTQRCRTYAYDERLAGEMSEARARSGAPTATQIAGAVDVEASIKQRSLAARYGADYAQLDACAALNGELASSTPLSVLILKAR